VKNLPKQREELTAGQQPYAIILGCSDSRVPPELLFDESLGQLFIVRDAGNVADSVTLGSIEYAAEHLHAKLLVVLGHTSCGAVKATLAGGDVPPNIGAIANRIAPAANRAKAKHLDEKETALEASVENVREQMDACVGQSTLIRELVEKNELKLVGAIYDLETGKVEFQ
jgi:carbonic anhydrase